MRPTQALINIEALRHNYSVISRLVGEEIGIIPVVKADAYGHGAVSVSWALAEAGAQLMAVATLDEALELLEAGIPTRFLILGGIEGETNLLDIPPNCVPVVWDEDGLNFANTMPDDAGRPVEVHVKVDTGMGRLGCMPEELPRLFEIARGLENIRITGVMSHLSSADGRHLDDVEFTKEQITRFKDVCKRVAPGVLRHFSGSAATIAFPEAWIDAVRPGLILYGIWPFQDASPRGGLAPDDFQPVMTLRSTVLAVKDIPKDFPIGYGRTYRTDNPKKIAIVPAGYADGISRKLSNRGQVLIGGKRRDILGSVTMDYIMADVTDLPLAVPGDEVIIMGRQGENEITAWEIARWAETIPYEVTCAISRRVTRISFDKLGRR